MPIVEKHFSGLVTCWDLAVGMLSWNPKRSKVNFTDSSCNGSNEVTLVKEHLKALIAIKVWIWFANMLHLKKIYQNWFILKNRSLVIPMDYIASHVEMKNHVLPILYYLRNREDIGDNNSSHLKYLLPHEDMQSPYLLTHRCNFPPNIHICTNSDERFHAPRVSVQENLWNRSKKSDMTNAILLLLLYSFAGTVFKHDNWIRVTEASASVVGCMPYYCLR